MGLLKWLCGLVEEVFLLPRWLPKWTGHSSGPVTSDLFGEKQTKKVGSILHSNTSEANKSWTWSCFSNGGDEFPLICTLVCVLHDSGWWGMTHIFKKAGQVRSSAQGRAQRDAQWPLMRMSHSIELQPEQAGQVPCLILLKNALAEFTHGITLGNLSFLPTLVQFHQHRS